MCRSSIYDARNNLSALVKTAESGEAVELTRYDKPVAVIISWADYEEGILAGKKKNNFLTKMEQLRNQYADVLTDDDDWLPRGEVVRQKYNGKYDGCFDFLMEEEEK